MANEVHRDITVIGASAGGIGVLRELLTQLPADYPAAVFVVVHLAPESPSILPHLLGRHSALPVLEARTGRIRPGTVMIAPPDQHLVLDIGGVHLAHGPRENRHRPSIDVLFRSAATAFGSRVTGVVLSGMLDDGAAGLWAVKRQRGATVVQDPDDAEYPDMPRHALERIEADHVIPAADLAATLRRLAAEPVSRPVVAVVPINMAMEVRMAAQSDGTIDELDSLGKRSAFTCPECGGTLWELIEGGLRYRCHVGHAYSAHTLAADQTTHVEAALWAALRSLEENVRLSRRMAADATARGADRSAKFHEEVAQANESHAGTLRELMASAPAASEPDAADG